MLVASVQWCHFRGPQLPSSCFCTAAADAKEDVRSCPHPPHARNSCKLRMRMCYIRACVMRLAKVCWCTCVKMSGRREVLQLYRAILRRGQSLRYTDKEFFRRTVQLEFRNSSRDHRFAVNLKVLSLCPFFANGLFLFQQKARYFLDSELGGLI